MLVIVEHFLFTNCVSLEITLTKKNRIEKYFSFVISFVNFMLESKKTLIQRGLKSQFDTDLTFLNTLKSIGYANCMI